MLNVNKNKLKGLKFRLFFLFFIIIMSSCSSILDREHVGIDLKEIKKKGYIMNGKIIIAPKVVVGEFKK